MSRLDEPTDRASVVYSARLTVRAHDAGYQCVCCRPDGCEQDAWARRELGTPPPDIDRPHETTGAARRTA